MGKVKQFYRDTEDALDEPDEAAERAAAVRVRQQEALDMNNALESDRLQKINDLAAAVNVKLPPSLPPG